MLVLMLSLIGVLLAIYLVVLALRHFWAWMARGKPLKRAIESGSVDDDIRKTAEEAKLIREERKLSGRSSDDKRHLPKLNLEKRKQIMKSEIKLRNEYLDNLKIGWYQFMMIFIIGSMLGLVIEEVWMYVTAGVMQSRVGLVWGPFSPLYGVCLGLLTGVCWPLRKKGAKWWVIFIMSVVGGGLVEQITGWGMSTIFHVESWSYLHLPDHITQWVAWRFLVFWGIIGVVWYKLLMPTLLFRIGEQTTRRQTIFITIVSVYMIADIGMTMVCFNRCAARDEGIAPQNAFESWVDVNYNDEWIESRFQNMTIGSGSS